MTYFFYVISGILVSILFYRFLISIRSAKKFSRAVLPAIIAVKEYAQVLKSSLQGKGQAELLAEKKRQLQKALTLKSGMYPEWVFGSGFNPGLRAGTRSFLIKLDRVVELLFAMECLMHKQTHSFYQYMTNPSFPIMEVMQKNEELIAIIESYFKAEKQIEPEGNFTSDITMLENGLHQIVPNSIELLDISPDYLQLTALVRSVKDMRQVLLAMISALPSRIDHLHSMKA